MMTKLNLFWSSKTELCSLILHPPLFELVTDIPFITQARKLGIIIASNTTMDKHVTNICRSAYAELLGISSIRHLLSRCNPNSPLCLWSLKVRLLQLPPLWLTSIHSWQASKSTKFCSKISYEIPQVWSCTASYAQPSLVTSPLEDWLQDCNPALQHFHRLLSRLYRSASIRPRLYPLLTPPFILGHTYPPYSFRQNEVIRSKSIVFHGPNSTQLTSISPSVILCGWLGSKH